VEAANSELSAASEAEAFRRRFKTMLRAAEREADRRGTLAAKRVLAEADTMIRDLGSKKSHC